MRQPHFDAASSVITIQGENDNCTGVACDEDAEPFQLADFIFIPVCIQKDATPGTWNISVQTEVDSGSSGQMEFVNTSFEVR
jgi:hypothetical protein